jgi:hypothetical protein
MNVAAIGGMHATAKPRPTLPNRRRTKPATGAAMHAISPAVQIATAESSPCIPSGPLPKKKPGHRDQQQCQRRVGDRGQDQQDQHEVIPFGSGHTGAARQSVARRRARLFRLARDLDSAGRAAGSLKPNSHSGDQRFSRLPHHLVREVSEASAKHDGLHRER